MLSRVKNRFHHVVSITKTYLRFYKPRCIPEYDVQTDISKCMFSVKRLAYYVGCEDNRSERYRVRNFVDALRKFDISVDIYTVDNLSYILKRNYDVVVIFREDRFQLIHLKKVIKNLKRRNITVIYDTDDFTIENEKLRSSKNILHIIRLCDAVSVTTQFLADLFAKKTGKPVYVIRNTINERQLYIAKKTIKKRSDEKIRIVYQSGTPTHNKDFEQIENSILFALEKYPNTEFHIFGPLDLSWKFILYSDRIFNYPYMDYLKLQCKVSHMDINIAPLVINAFNNSKSELKIFEGALLKIPTICSPTEPYKAIIKNGTNGFVAETVEDWKSAFSLLIENAEKRKTVGENAFNDFVPIFNVENEVKNVIATFEKIKAGVEE